MMNNVAQPSMSTTRRRKHGKRWKTYLLNEHIAPAVCYRVEIFLLLEEKTKMAAQLELMWRLQWTDSCLFKDHSYVTLKQA